MLGIIETKAFQVIKMLDDDKVKDLKKRSALAHYREDRLKQAKLLYAQVCELDPFDAEAWFLLGTINSRLGYCQQAEPCFRRAVELAPKKPEVHFNLGVVLDQLEKYAEAEAAYREVLCLNPTFISAHINLGVLLKKQGRLEESLAEHRATVRLAPTLADGYFNLGNLLKDMGKWSEAEAAYREALKFNPAFMDAYGNLGNLLRDQGRLKEARDAHLEAVRIMPNDANAYFALGSDMDKLGWFHDAVTIYSEAIRLKPDHIDACLKRASLWTRYGDWDKALQSYRYVLSLDNGCAGAKLGEAWVYERRGEYEQAYSCLRPFLEVDNPSVASLTLFASVCRPLGLSDEAINLIENYLAQNHIAIKCEDRSNHCEDLANLHYALGRLYDCQGRYNIAFHHYRSGNETYREAVEEFDIQRFAREVDGLIRAFSTVFMRHAPRATITSHNLLFIVGMPRSGTSLIEQILDSHPSIYGGGELDGMYVIVRQELPALIGGGASYPECMTNIGQGEIDRLAISYLDGISQYLSSAQIVTDKMPHNFLNLGLISLLFPHARIIHCLRDPLDTCLSCYVQNFDWRHSYTRDMTTLGGYYQQYRRLMRHWTSVIDLPILEVRYEELVEDPRGVSREMVEFCGLDWDERCLRYYDNRRVVATASQDQVRQPIYKHSIGRSLKYMDFLGPLVEALSTGRS